MATNVNFVVPSWYLLNNPLKQQPLVELYLTTILDRSFDGKIDVGIIDFRGLEKKTRMSEIVESDIYMYSVNSPYSIEINSIVKEVREKYPDSKHIAGGTHINLFPEDSQAIFDSIVLGDGEKSIIDVVKDFENGKLKKVYDEEVDYYSEDYPFPNRIYLPYPKIVRTDLFKSREISGTTAFFSRGCPFSCSFCANYKPRKTFRKKLTDITEEIEYLKENYSIEGVAIAEDVSIPLKKEEAIQYIEAIGNTGVYWRGQTRAGLSEEVIKLAREAGCLELAFGIESASQEVLDKINKKLKIDKVKETMKYCNRNDIKVQACLISGLPNEPPNIVEITKSFVEETEPDVVMLSLLVPHPGSPIAKNPEKFGIRYINPDLSKYINLIGRFENEGRPEVLFEYHPTYQGRKNFSRREIQKNFLELQEFFRQKGLNK